MNSTKKQKFSALPIRQGLRPGSAGCHRGFTRHHFYANRKSGAGFTLIELLIVIGIIAILAAIVIMVINPAEYMRRSRDSRRIADLNSLNHALTLAMGIDPNLDFGEPSMVYTSLPDEATTTCDSLGLPAAPSGWNYHCAPPADLQKIDKSGWVPVDFAGLTTGSPLSFLPIDPVNASSSGLYYTYNIGGSWKLTAIFESSRDQHFAENDGGIDLTVYEVGTAHIQPSLARGNPPTPTESPDESPAETETSTPGGCNNQWLPIDDLSDIGRAYTVAFSINNKGYVGTGTDSYWNILKDFWRYDPQGGSWSQMANFGGTGLSDGVGRAYAVGFAIGAPINKGYVGTGFDENWDSATDFWEYDPGANEWTEKTPFEGPTRDGAVGFSIGGKGYIATGEDGIYWEPLGDLWEYDPNGNGGSGSWDEKANLTDFGGPALVYAAGFAIGSKGYIGTGDDENWDLTKDFWEYDPTAGPDGSWTEKAPFEGTARDSAVAFSIGNKGYIGTGYDDYDLTRDFWEYDPSDGPDGSWAQKSDVGGPKRASAAGFSIDSKGYIGTGWVSGPIKDFYEYCPGTGPNITIPPPTPTPTPGPTLTCSPSTATVDKGGTQQYTATYDPDDWGPEDPQTVTDSADWSSLNTGIATVNNTDHKGLATGQAVGSTSIRAQHSGLSADCGITVVDLGVWTRKADFGGTERQEATGFSLGNKGYIGLGINCGVDFWEYNLATDSWTQKADFGGTVRDKATGFSIGAPVNKGYIGTGYGSGGPSKEFWEYDPVSNVWTKKTDFGGIGRVWAVGFSIGAKGYLGTGADSAGNRLKDFWEYDPVGDNWVPKTDFGGLARYGAVGFSIGSFGYLGTGYDTSVFNYARDFWEFDPSGGGSWTKKADFGWTARVHAVGFAMGGKGYIGTGYNGGGLKDFGEYDPASDKWNKMADFGGVIRYKAVGFSIGTEGFIGTGAGWGGTGVQEDFWEYTPGGLPPPTPAPTPPNLGTWTKKADFGGDGRSWATGFTIGTYGYIGLGVDTYNNKRIDFWQYDSSGDAWTQVADYPGNARMYATGFSIGTKGYVGIGRDSGGTILDEFYEYNPPPANSWTPKANFGGGVRIWAVGFSIGSKGYLGTGYGYSGVWGWGPMEDFWEFDPSATSSWTQKADFGGGRRQDAVGFSISSNGKGYIGTGQTAAYTTVRDFWEFDPSGDGGNGSWTQKTQVPGGWRTGAVGFSVGAKGYVGLGNYCGNDFWEYDPSGATWTRKADCDACSRMDMVGLSIGGKGYVGPTGLNYKQFWQLSP